MRRLERIFQACKGDWLLERSIPGGTVTGTARFASVGPTVLHYREEGRLTRDSGCATSVWQDYNYVLEPDAIRVEFAAGRTAGETLHRLTPVPTRRFKTWPAEARDVHQCGTDTYRGHYRFETRRKVSITISVEGPTKGYTIHSVLSRPLMGWITSMRRISPVSGLFGRP